MIYPGAKSMITCLIIVCQVDLAKRPVRRPPKAKKARIEVELKHVLREEYECWVSVEKYDEAWFFTY